MEKLNGSITVGNSIIALYHEVKPVFLQQHPYYRDIMGFFILPQWVDILVLQGFGEGTLSGFPGETPKIDKHEKMEDYSFLV